MGSLFRLKNEADSKYLSVTRNNVLTDARKELVLELGNDNSITLTDKSNNNNQQMWTRWLVDEMDNWFVWSNDNDNTTKNFVAAPDETTLESKERSLDYTEQVITLTDESTGLLLDGPDNNKIKLQIKKLDLKQRWKKENVDGTYFYLITYEDKTKVLTRESENTLEIKEKANIDSQLWKLTSEKKLENKDGNWIYMDKVWIFSAFGEEGGPIEDVDSNEVLDYTTDPIVTLATKNPYKKQNWEQNNDGGYFTLKSSDGSDLQLSAVNSDTLAGFRPNQVLALGDTCIETDETCTIQLKTEVDNENRQKWERNVQDDVDEWFTLYNAQTKKYNTAENKAATTATSWPEGFESGLVLGLDVSNSAEASNCVIDETPVKLQKKSSL